MIGTYQQCPTEAFFNPDDDMADEHCVWQRWKSSRRVFVHQQNLTLQRVPSLPFSSLIPRTVFDLISEHALISEHPLFP